MGKTPARNTPAFWNGTNAWVSISDLTSSRKYISQTRECITDNAITRTGIKKIPKDTLLMSFKLSLGKVAITTTDIYTNEAIMAFIDKKKYDVDIHYMYHYFQAIDWTIGTNKAVKGITLNKRVLSEKVVDLPPINIQQEIAERMDNLNAVTENLQRQFMLLDELVKSQFVELFGDLEANPKGWKKTTFDEVSVKITDGEHATVPRVNTGYIFLNARNVLKSGVINLTGVTFISEDNHNRIYKRCNPEAG
ncbi:MAG: restriction endonuclease subunit S, partial [Selenomonas sp.]|nr:restriction endonuclease subunit S [Selenomonas sp.]